MSEPRTAAGWALIERMPYWRNSAHRVSDEVIAAILAIEAEAAAAERAGLAEAVRFRASTRFINLDPQPEGPDLLDAIAAYMDRQDDAAERRGDVEVADRAVQADVRRWAADLRAALLGEPE